MSADKGGKKGGKVYGTNERRHPDIKPKKSKTKGR